MTNATPVARRPAWAPSKIVMLGLTLVGWVAAFSALGLRIAESNDAPGFDFYQFWVAGGMVRAHEHASRHGVLDLYSPAALHDIGQRYASRAASAAPRQREASRFRTVLENASTPFFYWVFSLITSGHYNHDFTLYVLVSLASLAGAIFALAWRLDYSIAAIGAAIALAASSSPVISDSYVVNVNCPQLAMGCVYFLLRDRARSGARASSAWFFAAGVLMGMFVAFKPNLLLAPVFLSLRGIFTRRWRELIPEVLGTFVALGAAIWVSSWRFGGAGCWIAWAGVVHRIGSQPTIPSGFGNFAPARAIYELTGHNVVSELTIVGQALAIGALWLGSRSSSLAPNVCDRDSEFRRDATIFSMAAIVAFLTSGLAWVHYPILIFPLFLVAAGPVGAGRLVRRGQIIRFALLGVIISLFLYPPAAEQLAQRHFAILFPYTSSTWDHCDKVALVLALGLAIWMEIGWFRAAGIVRSAS